MLQSKRITTFLFLKIPRGKMTEEDRIGLLNEIDILKQVDHPNIVKLINVYEDELTFSLVLELMTGGEVSIFFYAFLFNVYVAV